MAYNTLEHLEKGIVDFVYSLTAYDYTNLIKSIRKNENKLKIINGFLSELIDTKPQFCFEVIYDMPEFTNEAEYILNKYYTVETISKETLEKLLNNSQLGLNFLKNNLEQILIKFEKDLTFILKYLFENFNECLNILKKISLHSNLHIRFLFMKYLLEFHSETIDVFYDDITLYLTNFTNQEFEQLTLFTEYMDMKEVCELAYLCFENELSYNLWVKFKDFIMKNYEYNELAYQLLSPKKKYLTDYIHNLEQNISGIEEFDKDADILFKTSSNYRLNILTHYSQQISKELLEEYEKQLIYFKYNGSIDQIYKRIDLYGLSRILNEKIEKYLSLSKNHSHIHLENGSTASCYRIGDYVFKLIKTKWSYEDIICPNLYLILPNLEEYLVRDEEGIVLAGFEVQKYLKRDAKNIPRYVFSDFKSELYKLGYYVNDELIDGICGDNCRLLDSYQESGKENPPEWFKDYPLVLVDRDRVYKNNNKNPKQLRNGY